jgi:hypothetical protein
MRILLIPLLSALVMFIPSTILADPWKKSVDANITLTQNAYSDNWVGGEAGSLSWTFNSNSLAEKQLNPKVNNKNTLKLSFGQTHSQDKDTKKWAKPVKSTDLVDFETVFRFTLGGFVDPFLAGRIETQFYDVSDPQKDRILNPVTFTESFGVARVWIKQEKREWTTRLGMGLREHLDRSALVDSLTGKRGNKTSNDGGFLLVDDFKTPLAHEKLTYTSKLTVFQALFYSESKKLKGLPNQNYWKSADVNWENIFTASITKYLMVNLYVQFLYDKEIRLGGRLKQTLSLGLTYKLI